MKSVTAEFGLPKNACMTPYGNGHINDTYYVDGEVPYIIQRINRNIFPDSEHLMNNISAVTQELRRKIVLRGGDPERETLTFTPTKKGALFYRDEEGFSWRACPFIRHSMSLEQVKSADDLRACGFAFGRFQKDLSDFDASTLYETIPFFHDTTRRLQALKQAVSEDRAQRLDSVRYEAAFYLSREYRIKDYMALYASLPLRVTHNDTKLNNVLFDASSRRPLCVIDLDTVMPGVAVNDFGDSIRFGASTAAEDETDLSKVHLSLEYFNACRDGFIEGCAGGLTDREIDALPVGAFMMTVECGMRFLTDYLQGDTYFKISRPRQNLDRARTHIRLVEEMEKQLL